MSAVHMLWDAIGAAALFVGLLVAALYVGAEVGAWVAKRLGVWREMLAFVRDRAARRRALRRKEPPRG